MGIAPQSIRVAFTTWLSSYGRAWIEGDPEQVVALFTADAAYHETPFDPPMIGHDAIRAYWREGAELGQRDVNFAHEVLAVADHVGVARWQASFVRTANDKTVELDGVLLAEFHEDGRCRVFREWWHGREQPQVDDSGSRARHP